jgi:drug/metabolite transporter (DMT)-like permease
LLDSPWLLALGASFLFGLALVLTQFGLRHLPAGSGASISVPTSAMLFWLLAPLLLDTSRADARAVAIFVAVGVLFPATVTLLTFEANRQMGPNVAGALGNLAPVFAVLAAAAVLGEAPDLLQSVGIVAIVAGVVALSLDRQWLGMSWPAWAVALPLAAAAIRGSVQPVAKYGLALWPAPFAAALIGYTVSSVVVVGAVLMRFGARRSEWRRSGVLWFAGVGVCNGGAVLAMYAALGRGPVTLVSPLVATYPMVTLALTALLMRSARTGPPVAVGVAATVAGVAMLIGHR